MRDPRHKLPSSPPGVDMPADCHDARPNSDIEGGRVKLKFLADDHLADVVQDLAVWPLEDAEHIRPADDADELALRIDDRQTVNLPPLHDARGIDHRAARPDGD